jgi:glucose/arabinose dehydrogenase
MALVGDSLYVANTDAILQFPYEAGKTRIASPGKKVHDLPAGCLNYHWTRNLVASPDGHKLYVTVGSNSDHGQWGPDKEENRAAIWELDLASASWTRYASGLRNPNGLDWEPETGAMWVAVNERDKLGNDLVPDYMTDVRRGDSFGWPCVYYGKYADTRVPKEWDCASMVDARTRSPAYALGNHTASLGLAFAKGNLLPPAFRQGVFIGQHGSWNRDPWSGYKVIFVAFEHGQPKGEPVDVITGFRNECRAFGRPVGVAIDSRGALLVADDVGNVIWRVGPASIRGEGTR